MTEPDNALTRHSRGRDAPENPTARLAAAMERQAAAVERQAEVAERHAEAVERQNELLDELVVAVASGSW